MELGEDAGAGGRRAPDEVDCRVGAVAREGEEGVEAWAGGAAYEDGGEAGREGGVGGLDCFQVDHSEVSRGLGGSGVEVPRGDIVSFICSDMVVRSFASANGSANAQIGLHAV